MASLIWDRCGKPFPVDPLELLRERAEVEFDDLPAGVDGIALYVKAPDRRPLVILREDVAPSREAFTAGHELGHVVIPWHVGRIVSQIDSGSDGHSIHRDVLDYATMEGEANRFSSELLMPREVRLEIVENANGWAEATQQLAAEAGTSPLSAAITLSRLCPPGVGFVAIDQRRRVTHVGRGPNSFIRLPQRGQPFRPGSMADQGLTFSVCQSGTGDILWLEACVDACPAPLPLTDAKSILRDIVDSLGVREEARKKLLHSAHGVVGAANSMHVQGKELTRDEIYQLLRTRFASRELLAVVVRHTDFESFLAAKAAELSDA